jgi:hypothetical protein
VVRVPDALILDRVTATSRDVCACTLQILHSNTADRERYLFIGLILML